MSSSPFDPRGFFPGPRGEQAPHLIDLLTRAVEANAAWRGGLHPADPGLAAAPLPPEFSDAVDVMLGELTQVYPFHDLRYAAHQQNDVLLASIVGVLAGTLFNANNVTTQSGTTTVGLEIDACRDIVKMIGGYTLPPEPEEPDSERRVNFSWTHLCSGGTVANIEALWVARTVAYFPLLVREICRASGDVVAFSDLANVGNEPYLHTVDPAQALRMTPDDALHLLDRLMVSISDRLSTDGAQPAHSVVAAELGRLLADRAVTTRGGYARVAAAHPPVVFAPATAHYSIVKAADALGMGRDNLVLVDVDEDFRMDIPDLRAKITTALKQGAVPVAVVCVGGATEEGSVDPVEEVLALRTEFESGGYAVSFWVHVDAAWGGYLASAVRFAPTGVPAAWVRALATIVDGLGPAPSFDHAGWLSSWLTTVAQEHSQHSLEGRLAAKLQLPAVDAGDSVRDLGVLMTALGLDQIDGGAVVGAQLEADLADLPAGLVGVSTPTNAGHLLAGITAFGRGDSITIDPHKMGHTAYPAGVVSFAEDRVRDLVAHKAPYITNNGGEPQAVRTPLRSKGGIASPGAWTLEGSRPASAACAVWLATRTLPLHREGHGQVMIRSLQAARYLHALVTDLSWLPLQPGGRDVELVPFVAGGPDTNIVMFSIRPGDSGQHGGPSGGVSLAEMNGLTRRVAAVFAVDVEGGELRAPQVDRLDGYVSSHTLSSATYAAGSGAISGLLRRARVSDPGSYTTQGVTAVRMVMANPYWAAVVGEHGHDAIKELVARVVGEARRPV